MTILGINEDHNATVALLCDGKVIFCQSEERITRKKNDVGYPKKSIDEALKETSISVRDIDFVAISAKHQDAVNLKIKRVTRFKVQDYVREMHEYWKKVLLEGKKSNFWDKVVADPRFNNPKTEYYDFGFMRKPKASWDKLFNKERVDVVTRHLGIDNRKVILIDHHLSHAAYAYFASPIDKNRKTAVVTADGWGDGKNASVYLGQRDELNIFHETAMCNLARIYRFITLLLGMRPYEHEYKVMGLAPYAKEDYWRPAYDVFAETLTVDGVDFKWKKKPTDMYFYFKDRLEGMRFDGIAGGLQKWLEELLVVWMINIANKLKVDQLVYSGGLSLNVKANGEVAKIGKIKSYFVPASGGDESSSIGAAYAVAALNREKILPIVNSYLGYAIKPDEIEKLFVKHNVKKHFDVVSKPTAKKVAKLIAQGKVIARCVGPMEFGARALGNRSILADPSKFENVAKLNNKIKQRDFWMPFTPSILDRRAKDYLVNPKNLPSPFMTIAFETTKMARRDLAAAIHPADFTARPQILTREANPKYYELISEFEGLTGIGALLNTSFNLHGEPIVRSAADAWHTFINSGLDGLLLEDKLILKRNG